MGSHYSGFYNINNASDVTFNNCKLQARRSYNHSSYEINIVMSNNVTFDNCEQTNFFVDAVTHLPITEATTDTITSMSGACWGAAGTNFCKNLTYKDSSISRFDAHQGLYNGKIIGCDIQGIEIVGFGEFIIEDTDIYKYGDGGAGNGLIHLRSDYGRTWKGTITFKDVDVYYYEDSSHSYAGGNPYTSTIFDITYTNWYWGYTCYYPNVVVDGMEFYSQLASKGKPESEHVALSADVVGAVQMFNQNFTSEPNIHLTETKNTKAYCPIIDENKDGYIDGSKNFFSYTVETTLYYYADKGYVSETESASYNHAFTFDPEVGIAIADFEGVVIENAMLTDSKQNRNPVVPPDVIKVINNKAGYKFNDKLVAYRTAAPDFFKNTYIYVEEGVDAYGNDIIYTYNSSNTHTCSMFMKADADGHWQECYICGATTAKENHTHDDACDNKCNGCGYIREVTHSYSEDWTSDETNHWHKCTNCDATTDVANHSYDNACDANCNVCDAERTPADHVYDNACDADCNECGETRTPADHVYENDCDADCNECGATRVPADHVYENDCDANCNVCDAERTPADHVYDNACDADCNECGATRTPADHVYENDCDADCNVCGATRVPANHVYDNACDANCNECGAIREVADHVYDNACDADCNECGAIREVADHVYDNACDADCNECGAIREVADHVYDNACDADCNVCEAIREVADHIYDNACDANCNECGATRTPADHVYDNNCDTDCNECGDTREAPHNYEETWTANDGEHWHECTDCGDKKDEGEHNYGDDATCDDCGHESDDAHNSTPVIPYE